MTPTLEVLTKYCAPYVDDIRLTEKSVTNKPVYAWTMWNYLLPQMSLFTLPRQMPMYLFGTEEKPNLVAPKFDSYRYTLTEDKTSAFVVALGDAYKGYELFSAQSITVSNRQVVSVQPIINASYDADSAQVTIPASADNPLTTGTIIDFDFYTDGYFVNDLSPQIMSILGICFEYGWLTRFENDWLSYVSKVEDDSFFEQNRANRMKVGDARLERVRTKLASQMRKLEQDVHYFNRIKVEPKI